MIHWDCFFLIFFAWIACQSMGRWAEWCHVWEYWLINEVIFESDCIICRISVVFLLTVLLESEGTVTVINEVLFRNQHWVANSWPNVYINIPTVYPFGAVWSLVEACEWSGVVVWLLTVFPGHLYTVLSWWS